jgi:hypothetical protein
MNRNICEYKEYLGVYRNICEYKEYVGVYRNICEYIGAAMLWEGEISKHITTTSHKSKILP